MCDGAKKSSRQDEYPGELAHMTSAEMAPEKIDFPPSPQACTDEKSQRWVAPSSCLGFCACVTPFCDCRCRRRLLGQDCWRTGNAPSKASSSRPPHRQELLAARKAAWARSAAGRQQQTLVTRSRKQDWHYLPRRRLYICRPLRPRRQPPLVHQPLALPRAPSLRRLHGRRARANPRD